MTFLTTLRDRLRPEADGFPRVSRLTMLVVGVAFVAAAVSLLWGTKLQADPQGWMRWGKQLAAGGGSFDTTYYPSWKPLPVLFTVPLSFAQGLGPALWLVVLRASALLAIALLFRLTRDLSGTLAGVVAAVSLCVVPGWASLSFGGHIEPLLLLFVLLAVERHRAGQKLQALGLGVLVALGREEAVIFLGVYGVMLTREDRRYLFYVLGAMLLIPLAWFGGDWLGSGDPLQGSTLAKNATDTIRQAYLGTPRPVQAANQAFALFVLPVWLAVFYGLTAAYRRRHTLLLWLAWTGGAWLAFDVFITLFGYPAETRFMLPAAGLLAIVAGVGAQRLTETTRRYFSPSAFS